MITRWTFIQKLVFLFLAVYLTLYTNSTQFIFSNVIEPFWQRVIPWFAALLGYPRDMGMGPTGSGDTTYDYFKILFFACLSLFMTTGIGLIFGNKKNFQTALRCMLILLRYYIAAQMINYGLAKLFYLQFSFPSEARLDQPLGDFSPMGLLWTFMGYSKPYTMFTGMLEFISGILMLSRRTSTLGALLTFGVMSNVMMMNFCYDVPVKLLSSHLVLMSLILILLDGKRLFNFFFQYKSSQLKNYEDITPKQYTLIKNCIKWLLIIGYLGFSIFYMSRFPDRSASHYFKGKHTVENFQRRDSLGQLKTSQSWNTWKTLYHSWSGHAMVKTEDDETLYFNFEPDSSSQTLKIKSRDDDEYSTLHYVMLDPNSIQVTGYYTPDSLSFSLHKHDIHEHLLVNRGFHWINEYPFNR